MDREDDLSDSPRTDFIPTRNVSCAYLVLALVALIAAGIAALIDWR
jgi:hypothetical protein